MKMKSPAAEPLARKISENIKEFFYLSKHSIRYKFTIAMVFIVLIPMGLTYLYAYTNTYQTLKKNAEEHLMNSVHIIRDQLESQFDIINQTSMLLLSNATIRATLYTEDDHTLFTQADKKIRVDRELKNLLLFNYAWDRKILKSVFIFEPTGHYYFISRNSISTDLFNNNFDINKFLLPPKIEKYLMPPSTVDKTIYLIRNIKDLNTQAFIGLLVLAIDVNSLSQYDHSLVAYKNVQIITYDDDGTIFSHTDKAKLGSKIDDTIFRLQDYSKIHEIEMDNQSYLVAAMKMGDYHLNSVIAIPKTEVFSNLQEDMRRYSLSIILSIMVAVLLGLYLSSRVVAPLNLLVSITKKVKKGNFHEKLPSSKYTELNQFSLVFNNMIDEIDYLINQVYEKQLLLKESELAMLQSQINPHFFFNVLETIGWEAKFSNNKVIYDMVSSLGELMRSCISLSLRDKIPIGKELEYVRHYLNLQSIRFGDKLEIQIDVPEIDINEFYIPKLCVLPIVENAIIHGLGGKRGKGRLTIDVNKTEKDIVFTIADDGLGFATETINLDLLDSIERRKNNHRSIGLYNSNKRIQLMYGDPYGITVHSQLNEGTTVKLCIPIDRGDVACIGS